MARSATRTLEDALQFGLQYETPSSFSASFCPLCFTCKSQQNKGPTSGLEPLTCSSYEFACVHTSPYWCVRQFGLFRRLSVCDR